ncbi:MAG: bifunctional riboflavin kinase/FAD synthetase, partial [Rhodospirillaceae bacterium]|nr:bifunctional riboflavin kinase/FAD synthetase [Rhodospirillaceae bacterium]
MRLFRHYTDLPDDARGAVVAIGNFDGIHRGHQAIIGEAGRVAQAGGRRLAVLTFEPHPRQVFQPGAPPYRLTPLRIKTRNIEELGVDDLFVLHFDEALAAIGAEDFVMEVLVRGLAASHVVVGYNFSFGHRRLGNVELLQAMASREGFGLTSVSPVESPEGITFSSTVIRDLLQRGEPGRATALLGRFWEIEGRVEGGDKRGRTIGFPTANVPLGEYIVPAHGVYAVRAGVDRGAETVWYDGAANLGRRPTVDGRSVTLEVHLFDFDGDLYGEHLRVAMVERLRAEKKFDGLDALKAQIARDCEAARAILARPAADSAAG